MTESGRIRKPATWKGFREDKNPKDVLIPVVKEFKDEVLDNEPDPAGQKPVGKKKATRSPKKSREKFPYLNKDSGWEKVDEEQKGTEWHHFEMEHWTIPVHNLERELWEDVPKGKILIYYSNMANYILPYIKDRPQSLN